MFDNKFKEFFIIDRLGLLCLLQKYQKVKGGEKDLVSYEGFKHREEYLELKQYYENREDFSENFSIPNSASPSRRGTISPSR